MCRMVVAAIQFICITHVRYVRLYCSVIAPHTNRIPVTDIFRQHFEYASTFLSRGTNLFVI